MRKVINKYLGVVLLIILSTLVIKAFIVSSMYHNLLGWSFYSGAISVGIGWILFFAKPKWYKYALFLMLFAGAVNIIEFNYYSSTLVFSWTPPEKVFRSIAYNPLNLLLFIVFVIGNFTRIMGIFGRLFSQSEEMEKDTRNKAIQNYITKLESKSESELQEINENPRLYQPEFVEAAQQLLDKKDE
jgi:hypothetical protein